MKWKSRSSKLLCPEVISGLTTTTQLAAAVAEGIDAGLDRERRRRTGHVHVVAPTGGAQRVLDLDRNRRIGPLEVRAADDHRIDVGTGDRPACASASWIAGIDISAWIPSWSSRPRLEPGTHPGGVEDTRLLHHVSRPDARGLHDELLVGQRPLGEFTGRDLLGVLGVPLQRRLGERCRQLGIADGVGWGEQAGPGDRDGGQVDERRGRRHDVDANELAPPDPLCAASVAAPQPDPHRARHVGNVRSTALRGAGRTATRPDPQQETERGERSAEHDDAADAVRPGCGQATDGPLCRCGPER